MESDEITLRSKIPREHAGKTLLDYLSARYAYKKPEEWRAEIAAGRYLINGAPANAGTILKKGDQTAYTTIHKEPWVNKAIKDLWQDEFLLFIDKPAPLPSHADGAFIRHTLIHLARQAHPETELFLGHRLDRETSGVAALAKSSVVLSALMPLFERGQVDKRYWAVARGTAKEDAFTVSGGMARDPGSEISVRWKLFPEGTPDTKPSKTEFKVLKRLKGYTLLECHPLTGRTNQIRVHLEAAGLPIAGDKLYGRSDAEFLEFLRHVKAGGDSRYGKYESERHLLHAASLAFEHPVTQEPLKIEAAMPEDMAAFIQNFSD